MSFTPLYIGTGIYGAVFLLAPLFIRRGPNQGIIRCSIYLSVFSMWIFWATVYIAQMKPIVGPRHLNTTLIWMKYKAGEPLPGKANQSNQGEKTPDTKARRFSHCDQRLLDNVFGCCIIPWLPARVKNHCIKQPVNILKLTCSEAQCAFREAGWSEKPGVVKIERLEAFYNDLAQTDVDWSDAMQRIKTQCLTTAHRYQGVYVDCVEYDILYCAITTMLRHGPSSSWSTAASCLPTKEYITTCPLCPEQCVNREFEVPDDSCLACGPIEE